MKGAEMDNSGRTNNSNTNNNNPFQQEIGERLDNHDENINSLVKKNTVMEKQLAKIAEMSFPDYSAAIETLTQEVRHSRENNQSSQLLALLRAINTKLDKMPKSPIKQLRILLFPEINPAGYYKIVFGRLIPWTFGFMATTYSFIAGSKALEIYRYNKDISQSVHYGKAWHYLQQHCKKKMLSAMDQAYDKTANK